MSFLFSCSMFFLSFTPLWISVIFIDVRSISISGGCLYTEWVSITVILLAWLLSLLVMLFELKTKNKSGVQKYSVRFAKDKKAITAEYLLSYILPLFAFNFTKWDSVVLFLVFFITLGFICVRHNYFGANIILEIARYSFYECLLINEDGKSIKQTIISNRKLNGRINEDVSLRALNNSFFLDVTK